MNKQTSPLIFSDPKEAARYFAIWELQTRQFADSIRKSTRSKSNLRKAKAKLARASA